MTPSRRSPRLDLAASVVAAVLLALVVVAGRDVWTFLFGVMP